MILPVLHVGFLGLSNIHLGSTNLRERHLVINRVGVVSYGEFSYHFRKFIYIGSLGVESH